MISFENVSKTYPDGTEAVRDLSMEVGRGETVVLLGTSGSGKTTAMKMVNRLIDPSGGKICVGGEDIMGQDRIALRRGIGYAIQHIGLFPHMTVGQNIAVVPQLLGWSGRRIASRVEELLSLVGLESRIFRDRFPHQLSGGQRQRVGVARALAADPPIVLMDEPFGALDPITREQLQNDFLALESEIQKAVLFVTHDVFEAVRMGDRIAILDKGELQQISTPRELVESPANRFVDDFLGRHRFQLSLLTRTVGGELRSEIRSVSLHDACRKPCLSVRSSLIEALDLFKRTGREELRICEGGKCIGRIEKSQVLRAISGSLEKPENRDGDVGVF